MASEEKEGAKPLDAGAPSPEGEPRGANKPTALELVSQHMYGGDMFMARCFMDRNESLGLTLAVMHSGVLPGDDIDLDPVWFNSLWLGALFKIAGDRGGAALVDRLFTWFIAYVTKSAKTISLELKPEFLECLTKEQFRTLWRVISEHRSLLTMVMSRLNAEDPKFPKWCLDMIAAGFPRDFLRVWVVDDEEKPAVAIWIDGAGGPEYDGDHDYKISADICLTFCASARDALVHLLRTNACTAEWPESACIAEVGRSFNSWTPGP